MTTLIVFVAFALVVSFLCSIMESVLLTVTPSFLEAEVREGKPVTKKLQSLKQNIDRPLAAILSLNTIAHTVGAAVAGAQAARVFGDAAVGVFSGILTLLILVFSEIIPKTLGAIYWRRLVPVVTPVLVATIWITWPLVKLSQVITRLLSQDRGDERVSPEEITAMAQLGEQQGMIEAGASRIIQNLFRLSSLRVRDVMTPRIVVFALPESKTVGEVLDEHEEFRFSRIPVYTGTRDDVTGFVLKDDLLLKGAQDDLDVALSELRRDMLVVPDNLGLPALFERMLDSLEHIALVVDEYGGVAGVVTMEDVVETLLGQEIVDEADTVEDMQMLARRQWFGRARRLGIVPPDVGEPADEDLVTFLREGIPEAGGEIRGEPRAEAGGETRDEAARKSGGEERGEPGAEAGGETRDEAARKSGGEASPRRQRIRARGDAAW